MARFSVGLVLTSLFGLVLVTSGGEALNAIHSLRDVDDGVRQLVEKRVPSLIALGALNSTLGDARIAEGALLFGDPRRAADSRKDLDGARAAIEAEKVKYVPLMVDEGDRQLFANFVKTWDASEAISQQTLELAQSGDPRKAAEIFFKPSKAAYDTANDAIDKAVEDLKGNIADESMATHSSIASTLAVTYVTLGIGIVLMLCAMAVSSLRVVRPIRAIVESMRILASGENRAMIPYAGRPDEIGDIARSVLVFQEAAIENERLEQQAAEHRAETDRARVQNERGQREAVEQERTLVAASIGDALSRLAAKDLTFRMSADIPDAYGKLQADFNNAIVELHNTMQIVTKNTFAIKSGSQEIATAANDLSRRTEQQAASLEETTATLGGVTATVRKTSEGANHACQMVGETKVVAEMSGEIVSRAIEAMSGIEASSTKMSQIIGVIDEIAFQTNLLALNAGVEAARAGDAGRGFAVVASEVRALAQRSADAAKEIKELILSSASQVTKGVDLVGQTGSALERIVQQVNAINGIVAEIATSAKEQATALGAINTAMSEMDQVTQQNAAMVQESTVASQALDAESENLAHLVGRFQTARDEGHRFAKAS